MRLVEQAALCAALVILLFAPPSTAQTYSKPWLVLPDSITTQAGAQDPRLLPWPIITQERGVVFNSLGGPGAAMGLSGAAHYNSTQLPLAMTRVCGANRCAGVIIQAGINDWGMSVPLAEQRASIDRVLDWAMGQNQKVLMLDIVYSLGAENGTPAPVNSIGLTLAQVRTQRYLACANYSRPAGLCTFALRPPEFDTYNPAFYTDGTHLSPAGWRAYATWVESAAGQAGLF